MNTTKGLDVETSNIGSPKRKLKARWTHEAQQDLDMMHRGPRKNAIVRAWQAFCEGDKKEVHYINREDDTGIYLVRQVKDYELPSYVYAPYVPLKF